MTRKTGVNYYKIIQVTNHETKKINKNKHKNNKGVIDEMGYFI